MCIAPYKEAWSERASMVAPSVLSKECLSATTFLKRSFPIIVGSRSTKGGISSKGCLLFEIHLSGIFGRSASLAIPHRVTFAAVPSVFLSLSVRYES